MNMWHELRNNIRINFAMKKYCLLITWLLIIAGSAQAQQTEGFYVRQVLELRKNIGAAKPTVQGIISAHRGGPSEGFPENAIETFAKTTEAVGSLIIECDIALTADSVLVLMHDNTLNRTTTGEGRVSALKQEDLKQLRLKDKQGNITPYKIPTLEEALLWGKGKVVFTLDVKRGVPFSMVIDAIRKTGTETSSVIITYNANQAAEVHELAPDMMISVSARKAEDLERLNNMGVPDSVMIAFVGTSEPDASVYETFHSKGILCILGTMGNLDKQALTKGDDVYSGFVQRGADILATDRPEAAAAALKK